MPVLHPATGGGYIVAPMGTCPDENVLVQLAHGGIESPSLRASLQTHLDGCGTCRQLVAVVAGGSAPLAPREGFTALQPGTTLGRYRVERLIGAGGMGVLYVAHDTRLDRRVALKLMHPSQDDEAGKQRLWREAQAMARLSHPNVVNVFDLGEYEGQLFVAMELVEGGTLREWLKVSRTWKESLEVLAAAGDGLAAAHRAGVVHRDFKPENVMLGSDGRPRVTDFGLARPGEPRKEAVNALATGPIDLTRTGMMLGTPAYMSPEQLLRQPADARSDQYSFCVTLYESLFGRRPHDGSTLDEVRVNVVKGVLARPSTPEVPDHVWEALATGLSVHPERRFPSMEHLLNALRAKRSFFPGRPNAPRATLRTIGRATVLAVALLLGAVGVQFLINLTPGKIFARPAPMPEVTSTRVDISSALNPGFVPAVEEAPAAQAPEMMGENTMLRLAVGESTVVTMPDLNRLAVGDTEIADVKTLGADRVEIKGVGQGTTTLLAWSHDGQRALHLVKVTGGTPAARETPLRLSPGEKHTLTVPDLARIAVGDFAVAEVKSDREGKIEILGKAAGTTTVLAWTTDGRRQSWTVRVSGPRPNSPLPSVMD